MSSGWQHWFLDYKLSRGGSEGWVGVSKPATALHTASSTNKKTHIQDRLSWRKTAPIDDTTNKVTNGFNQQHESSLLGKKNKTSVRRWNKNMHSSTNSRPAVVPLIGGVSEGGGSSGMCVCVCVWYASACIGIDSVKPRWAGARDDR